MRFFYAPGRKYIGLVSADGETYLCLRDWHGEWNTPPTKHPLDGGLSPFQKVIDPDDPRSDRLHAIRMLLEMGIEPDEALLEGLTE